MNHDTDYLYTDPSETDGQSGSDETALTPYADTRPERLVPRGARQCAHIHKAGHPKQGQQCEQWAEPDCTTGKCRFHGGRSGNKLATKHGRHTMRMPERIRERVEELQNDPDYVGLQDQISVLRFRLEELLERAETGDSVKGRTDLRDAVRDLRGEVEHTLFPLELLETLREAADGFELPGEVGNAITELLNSVAALKAGLSDLYNEARIQTEQDATWADFDRFSESLRKLRETEVKRMVAANQVLTVTESYNLIMAVAAILEREIEDPDARTRAVREVYALLNRKGTSTL